MSRERPIIFGAEMVRAILDGRKSMTRRVVKVQPAWNASREQWEWDTSAAFAAWSGDMPLAGALIGMRNHCPFGQRGDKIWVRETWRVSSSGRHYPSQETTAYVEWRAGPRVGFGQQRSKFALSDTESDAFLLAASPRDGWRPSIHMPRWASRITLEIEDVRVERLQDISEDDARAEGVDGYVSGHGPVTRDELLTEPGYGHPSFYRHGFQDIWERIHGPGAWDANPFVWAITFRRGERA